MPYRMCAASSSPATSLSRTAAQLASLLGTRVMPYFLSNPFREAMAKGAQSVSGIKPTRTVVCSGLSDPAAHAACIMPGSSIAPPSAAPACNKRRREIENVSPIPAPETRKKKRPAVLTHRWTPLSLDIRAAVGPLPKTFIHLFYLMQSQCQICGGPVHARWLICRGRLRQKLHRRLATYAH